jgi:two-component system LytT family sensor kinase
MTATRTLTPRRLLELFGIAFALIVIWAVVGLFAASEFYRRTIAVKGQTESLREVVLFQMVSGLNWALITPIIVAIAERLPLRRPVLLRNTLFILVLLPVIGVFRAVQGGVVLDLVEDSRVSREMLQLSVSIRTHRYSAMAAMIVVVTNLVIAQREAAMRARRELGAQTLLARAQLDDLRAQMQPHFLFKTLHTIREVVHIDPAAADDMVVGLADLLRRSLALGNDPVPLSDELDFVDRNLALYQICFGGQLSVRFDAYEDVLAARVPPLLVQQLVENAVVNGIAPFGGGEIEIRGWRDGEQLRLEVRDHAPLGAVSGTRARHDENGLAPVRARLEKLFGSAHSLTVRHEPEGFIAAVTMPFDLSYARPGIAYALEGTEHAHEVAGYDRRVVEEM